MFVLLVVVVDVDDVVTSFAFDLDLLKNNEYFCFCVSNVLLFAF